MQTTVNIEQLYAVFSIYPFNPLIEGSPITVSEMDKYNLLEKPLRELEMVNLSKYISKAITTWGEVSDFKHYLPRIFELFLQPNNPIDFTCNMFVKRFQYAEWRSWSIEEQSIIEQFLLHWWTQLVNSDNDKSDIVYLFIDLIETLGTPKPLLDRWEVKISSNGFLHYINFIIYFYSDLNKKLQLLENINHFSDTLVEDDYTNFNLNEATICTLIAWVKDNEKLLLKGVAYYETTEISTSIDMALEVINNNEGNKA